MCLHFAKGKVDPSGKKRLQFIECTVKEVPVGQRSPVLGREQAGCVVHGIEAIGADFKGLGGSQGVGLYPAQCPDDCGDFACIGGGGRCAVKVGFRGERYDRAILIGVWFGLVGRENSEDPSGEPGWCGLPTRGRAINIDPV